MPRRVLITGAGSGLGRALAIDYALRGDRVAVVDLHGDRAEQTVSLLESVEGGHLALVADVGSDASMRALRDRLEREWGGLEVLINNAGVASAGEVWQTECTEWDRVMNVNLMGVVRGCNLFVPMLLRGGGGQVINTASFAGLAGAPGLGAYGVAKAAVVALSEALRAELKAHGTQIAVLCPSFFQTRLMESCAPGQEQAGNIAGRLMADSRLSATDVARYTIDRSDRGQFLLLPHPETRRFWLLKRWFPETYFRAMLKLAARMASGARDEG